MSKLGGDVQERSGIGVKVSLGSLALCAWAILVHVATAFAQAPAAVAAAAVSDGEKISISTALTIGTVAIAVAVQLDQGRRARIDIKDLATKLEALKIQAADDLEGLKLSNDRKHEENSKKFERVDRRLGHMEQTLSFIRPPFRKELDS